MLNAVPEPTNSMKGMRRLVADPNVMLPEYSPAAGCEPESVTVKVEVPPAASVRLERLAATVAPAIVPAIPFTVQQEAFGARVTELDPILVSVTVFDIGSELDCTMPNEIVAPL